MNYQDIVGYRNRGTSNLDIASMAAKVDPSFKSGYDRLSQMTLPQWKKEKLAAEGLDRLYGKMRSKPTTEGNMLGKVIDAEPTGAPFMQGKEGAPNYLGGLLDYAAAPVRALAGGIEKGIDAVTGSNFYGGNQNSLASQLPQNLEKSGDYARVALPVAAGVATAGASVPMQLAASGIAGATGSLAEDAGDFATGEQTKTPGQIAGSAIASGVIDAGIDAATMGGYRLAKNALRVKPPEELAGEARKIVGKIIQGDKKSIAKAQQALQLVETKGVKSYEELGQVLNSKVSALAQEQDRILDAVQGRKPIQMLAQTFSEGGKTVKSNPTQTALQHLQELYASTGDPQNLVRIQVLAEKGMKEGLTAKELNAIAREYGSTFGQKAFSPRNGEALTSVNAQLYENTRKGVKNTARSLLPNEASKVLDQEMSSLYDTIRNVEKMQGAVQKLANKVETRGLIERGARLVGRGIDAATFGGLRGFLSSMFPSNIGLKTLNALEIQQNLAKNLSKFETLTKTIKTMSDEQAARAINRFVTEEITAPALRASEDAIPLSAFSPKGVADAATSKKILAEGGTLDDALNATR